MKAKRKKALKRQAAVLLSEINDQCLKFIRPSIFVKRIDIDYSIPVLITGSSSNCGMTQLAWHKYELFQMEGDVKKAKRDLKKFLYKMLRDHDKIVWDITPIHFKRFQFSTKKVPK